MKGKFKNVIKTFAILLSPIFIIALVVYLFFINTTYVNLVVVEEDNVNNCYNNTLANSETMLEPQLGKVGDKLYYSYSSNDMFKYGTYEVSSFLTKRIYWDGISPSPSTLSIDVVDDNGLFKTFIDKNGVVKVYNIEKAEYEPYFTIDKEKYGDGKWGLLFVDGVQYFTRNADFAKGKFYTWSDGYELYKYENNTLIPVFSTDGFDAECYGPPLFDNGYIYIYMFDEINEDESIDYLGKYDIKNKKIVTKIKLDEEYLFTSDIVFNDKVYGLKYLDDEENDVFGQAIGFFDMSNRKEKQIFECDGTIILNGYDEKLFVGVYEGIEDNGLYVIDTKTEEVKQIYDDKPVYGVYIVDNKWIYFVDEAERLYRITPDGKVLEKVFG